MCTLRDILKALNSTESTRCPKSMSKRKQCGNCGYKGAKPKHDCNDEGDNPLSRFKETGASITVSCDWRCDLDFKRCSVNCDVRLSHLEGFHFEKDDENQCRASNCPHP